MNEKMAALVARAYAVSEEANMVLLAAEELSCVIDGGGDGTYVKLSETSEQCQLEFLAALLGDGIPVVEDDRKWLRVYVDGTIRTGYGKDNQLPDWWRWALVDERSRAAEVADACAEQLREISHKMLYELAGPDATICDQCGRVVSAKENAIPVDVDGASGQVCWWCRKHADTAERRELEVARDE